LKIRKYNSLLMIYIAGDKHGFKAIKIIEDYLESNHIAYMNVGVKEEREDASLEEIIPKVVRGVLAGKDNFGILTCGTGIGVEIGANKFSGIRACLACDEEIAEWSKKYDNCNVLCLAGWRANRGKTKKILDAWFLTKYDGDAKRSKMFEIFDTWH